METISTPFATVYDAFFSKITDDMYMEFTEEDTLPMLLPLLQSAIEMFEFPRVNLHDYVVTGGDLIFDGGDAYDEYPVEYLRKYANSNGYFKALLTSEEINILATYMVVEWIGQQLATVDLIKMQYSGSDFKFTSQANHLQKLMALQKEYERKGFHLQRLYKRRKQDENGIMRSTFGEIMSSSNRK